MSRVIKAQETSSVRSFRDDASEQHAEPLSASDPREAHLAALVRENEDLVRRLRERESDGQKATASAREEGRREGQAAAARDEAGRLSVLRDSFGAALDAWHDRLAELDALAVLFSKAALEKVFAQADRNAELVVAAIKRRAERLREESAVVVRVSQDDFPDASSLVEAPSGNGIEALPIIICADLGPGECTIDLQLGHIDISPNEQWKRLAALLDEITSDEGAG